MSTPTHSLAASRLVATNYARRSNMPASSEPLLPTDAAKAATGVGVPEAALALVKTCVGTGIMALPFAFVKGGILSLPGLILLGLWNWTTSAQMLESRAAVDSKGSDYAARSGYSAIAYSAFGRFGVFVLESNLCVVLIGVCSSMQVQAAQLVAACTGLPYALCVGLCAAMLVPLVLQRTLRGISLIAAAGLTVLALGLLAVAAHGVARYGVSFDLTRLPARFFALPDAHECAIFFGIASFSFGLQTTLLPVQDGMRQPSRAAEAVNISLVAIVSLYIAVGLGLSSLYSQATKGVQQLILLNLVDSGALATAVQGSSALVALLSYPMPLMPIVELMPALLASAVGSSSRGGGTTAGTAAGTMAGSAVRLAILLTTSLLALTLQQFGIAAGFVGSLSIISSLVLPPMCHLKLCAWPQPLAAPADSQPPQWQPLAQRRQDWLGARTPPAGDSKLEHPPTQPTAAAATPRRRPWAAAYDLALIVLGLLSFVHFTAQFVEEAMATATTST